MMSPQNQQDVDESLKTLPSPLEAFYDKEKNLPQHPCFVQPYPDGTVEELNWQQAGAQIRRMAAYLRSLELSAGSKVAILSNNCAHWIMADIAIWMAGHISVPLFPVLTHTSIRKIIEHSEAEAIFIGKLDNYKDAKEGIPSQLKRIALPISPPEAQEDCVHWNDIIATAPPLNTNPAFPKSHIATLIYTSGTTGKPKGVMHSFANLAAVGHLAGVYYNLDANVRKLSYLPLAHAAERASVELNQLYYGYCIYFSNSLATFAEDLRRAKPTMFFAVPRIWQKLQQRVFEIISEDALNIKLQDPQTKELIKDKIRSALGFSDLSVAISGAAPIPTSLIAWYKLIDIEILEGYAMSENFAYSHTTKRGLGKIGSVGTPAAHVVCKISKEGEILVKSPSNMIGYYKEPELSASAFDEEGFLKTGDKGKIDLEGNLKITGRIKEIFKTSKGKYVAPAPIEDIIANHSGIEQCYVTGEGLESPLAVVTLSESDALESNIKSITKGLEKLVEKINSIVDKHENIKKIIVAPSPWTIDDNLITPTLKVKRAALDNIYSQKFETWSKDSATIIFLDESPQD